MTLGEFFTVISDSPAILLFFFISVPLTALLAWVFGRGEGHISPWKYLYSALIFLTCIPGIFAVTLNIYLFLFERQGIMNIDLYTQVLPILGMMLTLFLIRKNIEFDQIPGFDKLSGLVFIIGALITLLWVLEKTRIWVVTYIPFYYVLLIFVVIFVIIRLGWRKINT